MAAFSNQSNASFFSVFSLLAATFFIIHFSAGATESEFGWSLIVYKEGNITRAAASYSSHRKLLSRSSAMEKPNRIYGDSCTNADIVINQGSTASLPNGIPSYTVEITNVCVTGCDVSGIHIRCGWFSSARLINPKVFRRLRYNDCLVNDGKPLIYGGTISFEYSNTFSYPLSVYSVVC